MAAATAAPEAAAREVAALRLAHEVGDEEDRAIALDREPWFGM